MNLHKLILTNNDCWRAGKTIVPKGVMVHSTGANNPNLKRYVGPDDGLLGVNYNANHWNRPGTGACAHAFIGKLKDGTIATYQTLPWNMRGWHCGKSGNDTHISFEICEDGLKDAGYFAKVYQEAVELTAYLCKMYKLDPLKDGVVLCHAEGHLRGIASNHGDVLHWFPKFGKTMNDFRADVAKEIQKQEPKKEEKELTEYEIRAIVRDEISRVDMARAALPAGNWYAPYIEDAINKGIMARVNSGSIDRPQDYLTRQEAAKLSLNILDAAKK